MPGGYVISQEREDLLGGDGMAALSTELRHSQLLHHVPTEGEKKSRHRSHTIAVEYVWSCFDDNI